MYCTALSRMLAAANIFAEQGSAARPWRVSPILQLQMLVCCPADSWKRSPLPQQISSPAACANMSAWLIACCRSQSSPPQAPTCWMGGMPSLGMQSRGQIYSRSCRLVTRLTISRSPRACNTCSSQRPVPSLLHWEMLHRISADFQFWNQIFSELRRGPLLSSLHHDLASSISVKDKTSSEHSLLCSRGICI